jgi:phosphohistidine phosphatase
MKTLLLLRHGKAEPHNDEDKSRNLTDRGVRDARQMGEVIGKNFEIIDTVISSDAERAAQTARLAAESAGYKGAIDFQSRIYEASTDTLVDVVQDIDDKFETALLVGHNPGFEELFADLADISSFESHLPTCGLVQIELPGKWRDIEKGAGKLIASWEPKGI